MCAADLTHDNQKSIARLIWLNWLVTSHTSHVEEDVPEIRCVHLWHVSYTLLKDAIV